MEEHKTVTVVSTLPTDLELRLHDMIDEGGIEGAFCPNPAGIPTAVHKDSRVVSPGENQIDEAFWREFAKRNETTELLRSGMLKEREQEKKP